VSFLLRIPLPHRTIPLRISSTFAFGCCSWSMATQMTNPVSASPTLQALLALRTEHFDQRIRDLVSEAVATSAHDALDAAVNDEVSRRMAAVLASAAADQQRIQELTEQVDTVETAQIAPLREERNMYAGLVEEHARRIALLEAELETTKQQLAERGEQDGSARVGHAVDEADDDVNANHGKAYDALLSECRAVSARVDELQEALRSSEAKVAMAETDKAAAVAAATDDLRHALSIAVERRNAAERSNDEQSAEVSVLQMRVESMQSLMQSKDVEMAALRDSLLAQEARIRELTQAAAVASDDDAAEQGRRSAVNSPHSAMPTGDGNDYTGQTARRPKRRGYDDGNHAGNHDLSARAKVLDFWRDGHQRISQLEQTNAVLEAQLSEASERDRRLTELTGQRARLVASITALTAELESAREEQRGMAGTIVSLQAEAEALQHHLSAALHGALSGADVANCAAAFREAALKAAATQETVHHDPAALKKAAMELQALKHEVAEHGRRKAALTHAVADQRQALRALQATTATAQLETGSLGLSTDTIAKIAELLQSFSTPGLDDDAVINDMKLKRLKDLQQLAEVRSKLADTTAKLNEVELVRASAVAQLDELQNVSEATRCRLTSALQHARDELRTAGADISALRAQLAHWQATSLPQQQVTTALRQLADLLALQLATAAKAIALSRGDAIAARLEAEAERRSRDAAIRQALQALDNDVILKELDRHLDVMRSEVDRRRRRDHVVEAAERTALLGELRTRSEALAAAATRAKELSSVVAGATAAGAETAAWCRSVDEALAGLKAELSSSMHTATTVLLAVPADIENALQSALAAAAASRAEHATSVAEEAGAAESSFGSSLLLQSAQQVASRAESLLKPSG
jgi:chromosome segregation ATPase